MTKDEYSALVENRMEAILGAIGSVETDHEQLAAQMTAFTHAIGKHVARTVESCGASEPVAAVMSALELVVKQSLRVALLELTPPGGQQS